MLAFRIKEIYERYSTNVQSLLPSHSREAWMQLTSDLEAITDNWLTLAVKSLQIISRR